MQFIFEQIRTGGDRNFAYLIGDREAKVGAIIDPSYDPKAVIDRATTQHLKVEYVINTHGHPDHTNGNAEARELTGAPLLAHKTATPAPDVAVDDNQVVALGFLKLRFFHVPGHCPDHVLIHLADQRVALTGDLLFVGKIGGTGNEADARTEYNSLQRILGELPDETSVWPGHDYGCRPASTMALEKSTNPFLLAPDLTAFLDLKQTWSTFKSERGLK